MKNQNTTNRNFLKKTGLIIMLSLFTLLGNAQDKAADILGNYMVPSKDGAIQVYEKGGKYYGKIILNIQSKPQKNQQGSIQNISPAGSALPSPQINNLNSQTQNIHNIPAHFTASVNNHPEPINNFN